MRHVDGVNGIFLVILKISDKFLNLEPLTSTVNQIHSMELIQDKKSNWGSLLKFTVECFEGWFENLGILLIVLAFGLFLLLGQSFIVTLPK